MSRSSSASSFDSLDSKEIDTASEAPEDVVSEYDEVVDEVEEAVKEKQLLMEKLKALELKCEQQSHEMELMAEENRALQGDAKSDPIELRKSIQGKWKFHSSTNLDAFTERRRLVADTTDLDDVLLHVAEQNIEFHGGWVKIFDSVGPMQFNKRDVPLSGTIFTEGCAGMTFIAGGLMKTRRIQMGGVENVKSYEEERFIKDGKLHVITKMHGEEITRVYTDRTHVSDINGHWRQIGKSDRSISLNVKDGMFYRRAMNDDKLEKDSSEEFVIGEKRRGWETSVEGAMLVQKHLDADGVVTMVRKRFVENGELVSVQEANGKVEKWTFERVGEPLAP